MLAVVLAGAAALLLAAVAVLLVRRCRDAHRLAFLEQVVEQAPVGVAAMDEHGRVLANRLARRRAGLPDGPLTLQQMQAALADAERRLRPVRPDAAGQVPVSPLRAAMAGRSTECEVVIRQPDEDTSGTEREYRLTSIGRPLLDAAGRLAGGMSVTYDLTGLHEAHAALLRRDRDTAAIAAAVRAVLTGRDGPQAIARAAQVVAGAAVSTLFQPDGHGDVVATASTCEAFVGNRMDAAGGSVTAECYQTGTAVWVDDVSQDPRYHRVRARDLEQLTGVELGSGAWYPISTGGRCLGVLVTMCEVGQRPPRDAEPMLELLATETALALAHEDLLHELERLSGADPLTGVANRRAWELTLSRELPRAQRERAPLSLLMIDLDRFKEYNDRLGHTAGDRLLVATTQAWRDRLRPGDVLCRWGGEEFAVLLPNCSLDGARAVAEDLRRRMPPGSTCSIGVAEWDGEESMGDLVARADARLYAAKAAGRDRVRACDEPRVGELRAGEQLPSVRRQQA